jgi:acetyl esterase/lipase
MKRRVWPAALLSLAVAAAHAQYTYNSYYDLVYTNGGGAPQTLDLFIPNKPGTDPLPAIVFVHGGGWVGGSKEDFRGYAQYYAQTGYVTISINYRLTPNWHWMAQIDDCQAAVRWLRKYASIIRVNPDKIGCCGASAGGHLVLWMGTTDTLNDLDPDLHGYSSRVQAVVDYFGPTDMTKPYEWDPSIWFLIVSLVGRNPVSDYLAYVNVSPLYFASPDDAPTLMFHGDSDPIVPVAQSRRMQARLLQAGVPVWYYEYPGQGHGFNAFYAWDSLVRINGFFDHWLKN